MRTLATINTAPPTLTLWDAFAPYFFLTSMFLVVFYFTLYPISRKVFFHLSGVKMPGTFRMFYLVFSRLWLWLVWLPIVEHAQRAKNMAEEGLAWLAARFGKGGAR